MAAKRIRETLRKRLIHETLHGLFGDAPVLLDELRWEVLRREFHEKQRELIEVTESAQDSFTRTNREHCPDLRFEKIANPTHLPFGLLARIGVHRLKSRIVLDRFLQGAKPTVEIRLTDRMQPSNSRYHKNPWSTAHYSAVTFRFFERLPKDASIQLLEEAPGVVLPATMPITLVCQNNSAVEPAALATVGWRLIEYDRKKRYELDPLEIPCQYASPRA